MDNVMSSEVVVDGTAKKRGISGSTLKLVAIITMLIDHTAAVLVEGLMMKNGFDYNLDLQSLVSWFGNKTNLLAYSMNEIMRLIGRLAFPIFCFLLVEGFTHTRSAWKYFLRLVIFAAISEIPFNLAITHSAFDVEYQSVYFTLAIGLLTIILMDGFRNKALGFGRGLFTVLRYVSFFLFGVTGWLLVQESMFGAIIEGFSGRPLIRCKEGFFLPITVFTDGFWFGAVVCGCISLLVWTIVTFKKNADAVNKEAAGWIFAYAGMWLASFLWTDYSGWGVLVIIVMYVLRKKRFRSFLFGTVILSIMSINEATAFVMLPFVRKYNGTRGLKLKYLFYAFYPAHLLILYLLGHFVFALF